MLISFIFQLQYDQDEIFDDPFCFHAEKQLIITWLFSDCSSILWFGFKDLRMEMSIHQDNSDINGMAGKNFLSLLHHSLFLSLKDYIIND
jgi:hypothetical protein